MNKFRIFAAIFGVAAFAITLFSIGYSTNAQRENQDETADTVSSKAKDFAAPTTTRKKLRRRKPISFCV